MPEKTKSTPFLKWAGGKRYLLPQIIPHFPTEFERYYEPFLGGGATLFQLKPKKATISDVNSILIETYNVIKNNVNELIEILDTMIIGKTEYYEIRKSKPQSPIEQAARFIYLNKTCWNGLYRENSSGEFNVPFGRIKKGTKLYEIENLLNTREILKNITILNRDFQYTVQKAKENDLIYFDPPYTTSHNENGFIEYNASIFSWDDQLRLAKLVGVLSEKNCHVFVSNADHPAIRELYKDFKLIKIQKSSSIAGIMSNRKQVMELLITNG